MKIGLGQIQICWEDREGSLRKVEQCMNLLQNERTDLFLLPEMSLTGFSMRTEYTKEQGETIGLARELADNGVILQLNKGSFFREFGERSYHAARWILSRGLAGVIASDAHDPVMRTTDLAEMKELLETEYGPDTAELLLVKRPGAILRGK